MITEATDQHSPPQSFYWLSSARRDDALLELLYARQPSAALVLCNMKQQCEVVARTLRNAGWYARALHGNLEQRDREQVLLQFDNGSITVVIATDVAAGSLRSRGLELVVSFDLPRNPAIHFQRQGFVAPEGLLASLVTAQDENRYRRVEAHCTSSAGLESLPRAQERSVRKPLWSTLMINGGEKDRLTPLDVEEALVGGGLSAEAIGRVDIRDFCTYVAVARESASRALEILREARLHGKQFMVRGLSIHQ